MDGPRKQLIYSCNLRNITYLLYLKHMSQYQNNVWSLGQVWYFCWRICVSDICNM